MSYQPIENYGVIGDLHTVALVGMDGSIDFMCAPRFDSASVFAALLDDERSRQPLKPAATRGAEKEQAMLRSVNDLTGFAIGATDGDIGQVEAFYFDDVCFTIRHLVVDTGSWLSGRKVLISPRALGDIDWDDRRINATLTKAQVEKSPDIDTDRPVSRQQEIEYYRYYGYPAYWSGPFLWGGYPFPVMSPGRATTLEHERRWEWGPEESGDVHLRSSAAVIGYHIAATNGDIGHVEDFLVDDETWSIRYMVVDTSNWWFGRKVLVASEWITSVDWSESLMHVNMTRERIKNSSEYDSALLR